MSDTPNERRFEPDPEQIKSVRRYLSRSCWGVFLCGAFAGMVYMTLMATRSSRDSGGGLAMEGLLVLCALPFLLSLVNLGFAGFVAIFNKETRLAGGIILAIYIGIFSYYYFNGH